LGKGRFGLPRKQPTVCQRIGARRPETSKLGSTGESRKEFRRVKGWQGLGGRGKKLEKKCPENSEETGDVCVVEGSGGTKWHRKGETLEDEGAGSREQNIRTIGQETEE